jgi:osmotically-inducible protein OsmY
MKTDLELRKDVLAELEWVASIDPSKVGVTVNNGIVSLSGHVKNYSQKLAAEKAVKRVNGVKGVVQEIEVKLPNVESHSDEDIANAALDTLKWFSNIPEEKIKFKVEDGWVTLEGTVDWHFQKRAAEKAVKELTGIKGVSNLLVIKNGIKPENIKEKIKKAFERNAGIDADHVKVKIDGSKVTLEGTIQSWAEKYQAEIIARSAPGVTEVVDKLEIKVREMPNA